MVWPDRATELRDVISMPVHSLARLQAWIASISGLTPRIAMTRFML